MSRHYDLVVVGAGMAGIAAAGKCAQQGWDVAIVDELPYGGTCALRGCDPKKILRRGAEIVDAAALLRGKGIDDEGLAVRWADLMGHKRGFTDPMPGKQERSLVDQGVHTLHGTARFSDPHALTVGGRDLRSERFLIAVGALPRPLDFPGHEFLVDSTDFLELPSLPRHILFVGGGYISFEFAHIAARAGSSVTIVNRGPRPLKGFDPDLVQRLVTRGESAGIRVECSTSISSVTDEGSGYTVDLDRDGRSERERFDLVVHGAGRVPALDGLGLDAAGVEWTDGGIRVEGHLQSSTNPAVFAAGDAADTPGRPLTPVAVIEGKVAASNMLKGSTTVPDYTGVPATVFTIPELARVGLLEEEAAEQGIDVDIRFRDTSNWYSNYRIGETAAASKILVDPSTDTIVGAHLLGPEYAELINILGLAMKLGLTTRQVRSMTAAYPTAGSDLGSML